MIFRTLLFFVLMYFLVKIISRLFLPSRRDPKSRGAQSFFYRTFQQFAEQNQQYNRNRQRPDNGSQRFEEIEEAEFEDITEEEKSTGNTPE